MRQTKQRKFVAISYVNNEAEIFDKSKLLKKMERLFDYKKLPLKMIGDISTTFFGNTMDVVEEKVAYIIIGITGLRISKFKFTRLLKTTWFHKISLSSDAILVVDGNLTDSNHKTVSRLISSIELSKLVQNYLQLTPGNSNLQGTKENSST